MTKTLARFAADDVERLVKLKSDKTHLHHDGGGLYLCVDKRGGASWLYRYMFEGRARSMGLGAFPAVGLANARAAAGKARVLLKVDGRDPLDVRDAERGKRSNKARPRPPKHGAPAGFEPLGSGRAKPPAPVAVDAVSDFVLRLRQVEGMAARALELAILTAAKSDEVRAMRWREVDLDAKTWTLGASRRIPLSAAAMAVLEALPRGEGDDLVFPSAEGGMLLDTTLANQAAQVLRTGGVEIVLDPAPEHADAFDQVIVMAEALKRMLGDLQFGDHEARRRACLFVGEQLGPFLYPFAAEIAEEELRRSRSAWMS